MPVILRYKGYKIFFPTKAIRESRCMYMSEKLTQAQSSGFCRKLAWRKVTGLTVRN